MYNQALGVCRGLAFWVMGWLLSGYTQITHYRKYPGLMLIYTIKLRFDIWSKYNRGEIEDKHRNCAAFASLHKMNFTDLGN